MKSNLHSGQPEKFYDWKYFQPIVAIGFVLALFILVFMLWRYWESHQHKYVCEIENGKLSFCTKLDADSKQVAPESISNNLELTRKLYDGDGITISFNVNDENLSIKPNISLDKIEVPKASFNFDQPAHRKAVNDATVKFTTVIGKLQNSEAIIETLLVLADFTSGTDNYYRTKLSLHLQSILTQALNEGRFTEIHLYAAASTLKLQSLGVSQVVSTQKGVAEFIRNLPTQIEDAKELPFSPLVENLWNVLNEFTSSQNMQVLFFSDLEQNTNDVSFIQGRNHDILDNPQQISQVIEKIKQGYNKNLPLVPKIKHFKFLAMPKSNQVSYKKLQFFWLMILEKNGISRDKVEFQN